MAADNKQLLIQGEIMKVQITILAVALLSVCANARIYERCELARDMLRFPFFSAQLADWVCLVENESSRNSAAVGGPNTDGSYDYGLFQLNNRYWCGNNAAGGDCGISCQSLLSDDGVGAAVNCVQLIHSRMGLDAWYGWQRGCKGQSLPNLNAECGI